MSSDSNIKTQPIQIAKIEVVSGACDDPYVMLRDLGVECQRAKNRFYSAFVQWHREHGTGAAVRQWRDDYRAYQKANAEYSVAIQRWKDTPAKSRGPKPEKPTTEKPYCPQPFPPACSSWINRQVNEAAPRLHVKSRGLIQKREHDDLGTRKASTGGFKRWQRIVTDLGECPTFSRPQPIPFFTDNRIKWVRTDGKPHDSWALELRLDSLAVPGTTRRTSCVLRLHLRTGGRHLQTIRSILANIGSGAWKMRGSAIADRDGRFVLLLTYQYPREEAKGLKTSRWCVLHAGRNVAWRVRMSERERSLCLARGRIVGRIRMQVGEQRSTRNESSRYGSPSRKGHGQRRARPEVKNIEDNFKKTFNDQVTTDLVNWCIREGIGRLYFRSPKRDGTRFLITAGAGRRPGLWPWYQMQTMLRQKTERAGIEFIETGTKIAAKNLPKSKAGKANGKIR